MAKVNKPSRAKKQERKPKGVATKIATFLDEDNIDYLGDPVVRITGQIVAPCEKGITDDQVDTLLKGGIVLTSASDEEGKDEDPNKKVVIAGVPPTPLGRLIAEQIAAQHSYAPASFQGESNKAPGEGPMNLTLPGLPGTARYFISATFSFFEAGYQHINVSGVRTLSEEELDRIEEYMERFFKGQIEHAGKIIRSNWDGLPAKISLTINTINRL